MNWFKKQWNKEKDAVRKQPLFFIGFLFLFISFFLEDKSVLKYIVQGVFALIVIIGVFKAWSKS